MQAPPEKLGAFYLGAEYNLETGQREDAPVVFDARDLTTHAICVGMTGSGKTGLCLSLLEEAALDKVPAILIDPKGDLTNLLLQFPELRAEDFQPWINVDDARRKGLDDAAYAQNTAEQWRQGLADWGITPQRLRDLCATVDYTIYTPGSDAGLAVNILGSLAAPKLDMDNDTEALHERISGTVAALLGLVGVEADPVRSRETILLSNIFEYFWRNQQDLDLAQLILAIQTPPVRKLGVFDVDTFFPEKERFELAMAFNNLLATPSFQNWLTGEALDIDALFYTASGQPRHSIFYIAHLSDSERMFFVTLLLENLLTWVRRQAGTTSLRALLYFDEVLGYFPPVAEPPAKRPLLTLLKQARAFGLGVVLVTQNPVDLDYKGLTNAGVWFIGKLQAERDKERVLAGLQGARRESGGQSAVNEEQLITQLSSRVFLLHNVHRDGPVIFQTRWAHSYLRGPLTRPQISRLMQGKKKSKTVAPSETRTNAAPPAPVPQPPAQPAPAPAPERNGFSATPPALDPGVTQVYLPLTLDADTAVHHLTEDATRLITPEQVQLLYEAALVGFATVQFWDRKRQIDTRNERLLLAPLQPTVGGVDWGEAEPLVMTLRDLRRQPDKVDPAYGPLFGDAPEQANRASKLERLRGDLADWLYYHERLRILAHPELSVYQRPGERERDFKIRLQQAAREKRDAEVDKLRRQLETQLDRLQERLDKHEQAKTQAEADHAARRREEMVGVGETMLTWALGGRSMRGLSTAATKRRLTAKAGRAVEHYEQDIAELQAAITALEAQFQERTTEISLKWATLMDNLTTEELTPRRTDVNVQFVALAWLPQWLIHYDDGLTKRTATIAGYQLPPLGQQS